MNFEQIILILIGSTDRYQWSSKFRHFKVFYLTIFSDSSQEMNKFLAVIFMLYPFFFTQRICCGLCIINHTFTVYFCFYFLSFICFIYRPSIKHILVFCNHTNQPKVSLPYKIYQEYCRMFVVIYYFYQVFFPID